MTPFSFFCKNIEKNPPFHSVSSASQIQTFNVAVVFKKMKICFTRWRAPFSTSPFTWWMKIKVFETRRPTYSYISYSSLICLSTVALCWAWRSILPFLLTSPCLWATGFINNSGRSCLQWGQFRPYSVHSICALNGNCSHLHYSHTEDIDEDIKTTCTVCSWCVIFYYDYFFNWVTEPVLFDTGITQPLFLESEDSCYMNLFF